MRNFTRIFTVFCFLSMLLCSASAQKTAADNEKAFSLVKENAAAMALTAEDINNSVISDFYTTADGITMLYLQQAYKGIPVYNQIQTAAFENGRLVSLSGGRIPKIESKVNEPGAIAQVSVETAVKKAAAFLQLTPPKALQSLQSTALNNTLRFSPAGISQEDITVQCLWTPADDRLLLSWQVFIAPLRSNDFWLVRVNALTGEVIEKTNLTVSCQWDHASTGNKQSENDFREQESIPKKENDLSPYSINSSNYRVIPFPAESPIHPGGAHAVVADPWTAAPGNATTLKWNSNGTTDYIISRGNNVYAHEDRLNNNSNGGLSDTSSTALPDLNFLQAPDYTQVATLRANQKFATTNLFYWNNIMHDISYQYGFDEVSGNFQSNNLSRGGLGNDYVQADAQDGGGTNNANFATPVDGSQPRMQMYLFTYGSPGKDGDLDNGVVSHEYTHGISTRLTGGPANSSCLNNAEQMGEGWSDYFALMVTTNWATATTSDGALAHPIGNYVLNYPTTGAGIRNYPYSTNMSIDPQTYAYMPATGGEVHNVGELWTTMLWDMTWNMIQIDGINTNIYNASGTGGNSAALKLVTEGMRLQPCSPGFVDGRNAILKADTLYFAAKYSCAIWEAFARRGLGVNASQGSSNNYLDGVPDYLSQTGLASAPQTASKTQVYDNDLIDYTTQVTAGTCSGISNYYITDTLPTNVTYLSGGSYNAGNRVVTFSPITLAAGASASYTVHLQVNNGAYFPPVTYFSEAVPTATISSTWTVSGTAPLWTTSAAQYHSSPRSFVATDPASIADKIIATTGSYAVSGIITLSFWHYYNLEPGYDGGVVEISTNGGTNWSDLGNYITSNGYSGTIPTPYGSPIAGRNAFTGNSGGFIYTTIDLSSFSGQTIKIRFRMGSDNAVSATGWFVDDINLASAAFVINKMNVFNSGNVIQSAKTIYTPILPVLVTSTGGTSTRAGYATLAAAVAAINGGTIHTGTIICSVASGYTETAPAGGYSITATGTAANPISFQKNGTGANPILTAYTPQVSGNINDAVFKIIGGDYITITDFTIQENSANTTTATATNNMTEFGVALFYTSATNGAQHNTIQNNTISLNRNYLNSFGIYSNTRHSATAMTTTAEATSAAGSNSFNAVYNNNINNVNYGIVFIGAGGSSPVMDNGNDIGGASAATGNTISNWGNGAAASSYVSLTGSTYCIFTNQQINNNISYNTITSAALTVAAAVTGGISEKYTVGQPAGTISSAISNNSITVTNAATTGDMVVIDNQGLTALSTATVNIYNNTIANCAITGGSATSATFTGISNTSACGTLNVNNNIVRNVSSTATSAISSIFGFNISQAINANVFSNTINTIGAAAGNVYGLYLAGGTAQEVYKNKIYDLSATAAASLVYGAYISAGNAAAFKFHNNYIGDLRNTTATNTLSAVNGIYLAGSTASSAENIYFNTVYLAATSSGTNFSTAGIYHATSTTATTAALDLRNNLIINISTANGSGKTAAYRRSDATLTNFAAASNYNLLYAGTPGTNNLIYYDGTNADQSLAAFRYRVSPREDKTVSDNPAFLSITGGNANYLHIDPAIASRPESGGIPISGIADDNDGDVRNGAAPDIGADEFTGIIKDSTRPAITINTVLDSCNAIRRIRATITDGTGIPLTGAFIPRIYFKKTAGTYQSIAGVYVSGTAASSVWDFSIDPAVLSATNGDGIDYFIVAQDLISTVANIGSAPSAGLYAADVNTIVKDPTALTSYVVGTIGTPYTWTGNNTNWFSAANWCGGIIPTAANDVVIPAGAANYPIIGSGTASTKNISIAAGATVTVNSTGVFSLNGAISNGGTFSIVNGTLDLAGSGSVSVGGSSVLNGTVKNLSISKSSSITAGAGNMLSVTGSVTYTSGSNAFNTNNNLTLVSTVAGTASFGDMTNNGAALGNTVSGDVIVERYIGTTRHWQLLSVPTATTQTIRQSWMEGGLAINNAAPGISNTNNPKDGYGTFVTDNNSGAAAAGFDAQSVSGPSVKYPFPAGSNLYVGISSPSAQINAQEAYFNYVRGPRNSHGLPSPATFSDPTTLRTTGPLKTGIITKPVGAGAITAIGNPYASEIDIDKMRTASSGLGATMYVWDPKLTTGFGLGAFQNIQKIGSHYVAIPGGAMSSYPSGYVDYIESGQAFYVQGSTGGNVNFAEPQKTGNSANVNFTSVDPELVQTSLLIRDASNNTTLLDGALLYCRNGFNNGNDYDDGLKISNTGENVSIKSHNILLAIEQRQPVQNGDTMWLNVTSYRIANYSWKLDLSNMDAPGRLAFIVDQYTGTETLLSLSGMSSYDFDVVNTAGSYAANRFYIVFRPAAVVPVTLTSISAARQADKTILVKWTTENELNIDHYAIERSGDGSRFNFQGSTLPAANNGSVAQYNFIDEKPLGEDNFYRVQALSNNGQSQYSAIVKVGPLTNYESISVSPNPVQDHVMNIRFSNKPAGKYSIQLSNKAGQMIYNGPVTLSANNEVISIVLKKSLAAGNYRLLLRDAAGRKDAIEVVVEQ